MYVVLKYYSVFNCLLYIKTTASSDNEQILNAWGKYFILWDIVDPCTESNPNPEPKPNPNHNPNPDPDCGFTISHKMKYLRCMGSPLLVIKKEYEIFIFL